MSDIRGDCVYVTKALRWHLIAIANALNSVKNNTLQQTSADQLAQDILGAWVKTHYPELYEQDEAWNKMVRERDRALEDKVRSMLGNGESDEG